MFSWELIATDLHQDGEGEVEIEVRREGGGGGGEAVVTHRRHRPVEEHRAGSTGEWNKRCSGRPS